MTRVPIAIVLAAGGSTRMGAPKALLSLGGVPLITLHCLRLAEVSRRVVVVVGAYAEEVRRAVPPDTTVVVNPDWVHTEPADSLRCALREARIRGRAWVTPVDVPPASRATFAALLAVGAPAVPLDAAGRRGHPVLLDAELVARIRSDGAPDGIGALLACAPTVPTDDPDLAVDFDDPAAWEGYLRRR